MTLDFLDYLRLFARYGWTREQAAAMPAEKITRLLGLTDEESK